MKKNVFVIVASLLAMSVLAKDHTIVVRGSSPNVKGKTEIFVGHSYESDSIFVSPGLGVTDIQVTIKSLEGTIVSQQTLPVNYTNSIDVSTSTLPEGCLIEVRDNSGIVYSDIE